MVVQVGVLLGLAAILSSPPDKLESPQPRWQRLANPAAPDLSEPEPS
jgi:hypothetical protein